MNLVTGLSLRASEEAETVGIDEWEIGEYAVSHPKRLLPLLWEICTLTTLAVRLR